MEMVWIFTHVHSLFVAYLTQLLSDLLPWQILCGFHSKMVQSDLTVCSTWRYLDQPKNMIFVNCWFKHVVVELSKQRCQVEGPQNGNSHCVWDAFAGWKTSPSSCKHPLKIFLSFFVNIDDTLCCLKTFTPILEFDKTSRCGIILWGKCFATMHA